MSGDPGVVLKAGDSRTCLCLVVKQYGKLKLKKKEKNTAKKRHRIRLQEGFGSPLRGGIQNPLVWESKIACKC